MARRASVINGSRRLGASLTSALLALVVCGCGKPPGSDFGPSASQLAGPTQVLQSNTTAPPPADPVLVAEALLAETRARLEAVSRDREFNGYANFVQLGQQKDGLLSAHRSKARSLAHALTEAFQGDKARQPLSPLGRDLQIVIKAINKPALSAPVDYAADGRMVVSGEAEFLTIVTSLNLLAEEQGPTLKPELRLEASLFLLKVARHIANGATTREHYVAGLKLENTSLALMRSVLASNPLDQSTLRDLIAGIQSRPSNVLECLGVVDQQYLRDTLRLAAEKLESKAQIQRARALATAYLKHREQVMRSPTRSEEADGNSQSTVSKTQRKSELEMVKETITFKSAVELLAALEVYKIVNGRYPEALSQLVPSVLTRVPPDLVDPSGQFSYRLDGQKATLSSALASDAPHHW